MILFISVYAICSLLTIKFIAHNNEPENLTNIHNKYSKYVDISFIFDKEDLLPYKASPIDCGKDTFLYMYKKRIRLEWIIV